MPEPRHAPPAEPLTAAHTSAPSVTADYGPSAFPPLPPSETEAAGRFLLRGEIARGGMGIVYAALDPQIGREVAVKVLNERLADRPDVVRRFDEESRITGQLQHPAIPAVHEVGRLDDGRPYLAMKFVRGRTLADLIKETPAATDLLPAFEQVCQAVAYAHSRGVIHRDLKPANVMVGAFAEVQVMDWGLAKVIGTSCSEADRIHDPRAGEEDDAATRAGSMLGTPAYMPPEQAAGAVDRIDERADVFGLGAILCVLLTGEPPYVGEDVREQALLGNLDPCHARLDASGADPVLVALARRCLLADPGSRPRNAGEVAAAVADFRRQAEERARQAELKQARAELRIAEDWKRRKVKMVIVGLILVFGASAGLAYWRYDNERRDAEREQTILRSRLVSRSTDHVVEALNLVRSVWGLPDDVPRREETARATARALDMARRSNQFEKNDSVRAQIKNAQDGLDGLNRYLRLRGFAEASWLVQARRLDRPWPGGDPASLVELRTFGLDVRAVPNDRIVDDLFSAPGCYLLLGLPEILPLHTPAMLESIARGHRDRILGMLADVALRFPPDAPERGKVTGLLRLCRTRAGGPLGRWQTLLDGGDAAGLARLADEADVRQLAPDLVAALARDLDPSPDDGPRRLLRRAVRAHPTHPRLRFDLMRRCLADAPPRANEALQHATVLATLRPDVGLYHHHLGAALDRVGSKAEAREAYREALRLDPGVAAP